MTVTVGLIGHGYWGPNLLRNYMDLPDAWVKYVCDVRQDALDKVLRRYPSLVATDNHERMLADPEVDAVLVATPISTHHELALAALRAGKHVFVEKPLAASVAEAQELVATANAVDRTLMVGHTFVYSPPVRKVKALLDAGELGDVRFITSSRVNLGLHQKDVSVIWDLASHDLSILYYWLGETAEEVGVSGRGCVHPDIPDVAFLHLHFPSGVVASIDVSWLSPVKLRRTVVVGSNKMLLYDDTEAVEKVKLFDHGVDFRDPEDFGEFQLSYRTGDILAPKLDSSEPLYVEASHFIECVRTGATPVTNGRMGLDVVRALEVADHALRNGGCGTVPVRAGSAADAAPA